MRVLGVDPGSATTGFGVVERQASALRFVAAGTIRTRVGEPMPDRLLTIYRGLLAVIDEHAPQVMSLERNFVARNVQSAFRIGEARAAAMLAAARSGGNMVPPMIDAAMAEATLGAICGTLREEWGSYAEAPAF